jgi:hypothetical protein
MTETQVKSNRAIAFETSKSKKYENLVEKNPLIFANPC